MGSSCFARGNSTILEIIENFAKDNNIDIDLSGSLCENQCESGPNIHINGDTYHDVTENNVIDILNKYFKS